MRTPESILMGIMWMDSSNPSQGLTLRHNAQQSDALQKYGWLRHDGERFGEQELIDGSLNISTLWVKHMSCEDCGIGGDWGARIVMQRTNGSASGKAMLFVYFGLENANEKLSFDRISLLVRGKTPPIGHWVARLSPSSARIQTNYLGIKSPHFHNLTSYVQSGIIYSMRKQLSDGIAMEHLQPTLPNHMDPNANIVVLQYTMSLPFSIDVSFAGSVPNGSAVPVSRLDHCSSSGMDSLLHTCRVNFEQHFSRAFRPMGQAHSTVSKAAMSNMLGGIGYWYGHSLVNDTQTIRPLWNTPLYSAVPSRSFFPRGFLWDEGFHQLLIRKWSPLISRDILAHWFDLITRSGWMPREVILGEEAKSRVPDEFLVQSPQAANPPTLLFVLLEMAHSDDPDDIELLKKAWPRLEAWYGWYNSTQRRSSASGGSYTWQGRDATTVRELNPKTLTSGLDDYPRASHPTEKERHLDLYCWMALASRAMSQIGQVTTMTNTALYEKTARNLEDVSKLNALHFDTSSGQYRDYGLHTEFVELSNTEAGGKVRFVHRQPTYQFVPHFGYVSLFPLFMRLLPANSNELRLQMSLLKDPNLLWTPYGLRSLANSSSLYMKYNTEHDPPYWRGAIWINMNFLAIEALAYYGRQPGPYADVAKSLATELSQAVLKTVMDEYERTGYLWEQYSDVNGHGKGSHPFTGWTALAVLSSNSHINLQ